MSKFRLRFDAVIEARLPVRTYSDARKGFDPLHGQKINGHASEEEFPSLIFASSFSNITITKSYLLVKLLLLLNLV